MTRKGGRGRGSMEGWDRGRGRERSGEGSRE